jgi:zinc/manganese transport system ATP-binding protein
MLTDPALAVNNLSVSLGGREVLQDISFALAPGEFCGLIGANGSGKTTLLRTILGFEAPSGGEISGQGRGFAGYVPQKFSPDPDMPLRARDFVELGLTGSKLGLPLPNKARKAAVDAMLAAVDAMGYANQRIGSLSGGQLQRVLIAHALIRRPKLLLLDEPLASLDLRAIAEVVDLLRRLAREQKIAILISAHDMNPLLGVMDQIVYLAHGRAATGATSDVVRTEVLSRLYGYHIDVIRVHGRILVVAAGEHDHGRPHVEAIP